MRLFLIGLSVLALASCSKPEEPANRAQPAAQAGTIKGVDRSHRGQPAPGAAFNDPDGVEMTLAHFRGTSVLVNLWASWCAPCVKELPTFNRLAGAHRDDGQLGVIAVSQDSGPRASVVAFLDKLKIADIGAYQDPKMALSAALGPDTVLPTTILYDANGKEVWRYVGDLDWTSPEAAKLIAEATPGPID